MKYVTDIWNYFSLYIPFFCHKKTYYAKIISNKDYMTLIPDKNESQKVNKKNKYWYILIAFSLLLKHTFEFTMTGIQYV